MKKPATAHSRVTGSTSPASTTTFAHSTGSRDGTTASFEQLVARARLDEPTLVAIESRAEADLAPGRHGELAAELAALCHEHPLRERLRELLNLAVYQSGRQAEALRAYAEIRELLARANTSPTSAATLSPSESSPGSGSPRTTTTSEASPPSFRIVTPPNGRAHRPRPAFVQPVEPLLPGISPLAGVR